MRISTFFQEAVRESGGGEQIRTISGRALKSH